MPLTTEQRCELIERNTEELLTREELVSLVESGRPVRHYIGFEISGPIHLGTGLVCMGKVHDFLDAGLECTILLADWHTWINEKLGGDREIIRRTATGYFTEGLKASLRCVGADPARVRFVLASDLYREHQEYWATVIEVSKHTSLARMQRSISIMGRGEGEAVDVAKLIYPAMQAADIFAQSVHIAHAGMDQRKAHVIARDVAHQMRVSPLRGPDGGVAKPLAVHHPLILGLGKPPMWPVPEDRRREVMTAMKMSKSQPGSAVLIHDDPETIRRKIGKAFCTPGDVSFNPVLDWMRHLVFALGEEEVRVDRPAAKGGAVTFSTYADLEASYRDGALHPMDLKAALAERLIERLRPAREHFATPERRQLLDEMEAVSSPGGG